MKTLTSTLALLATAGAASAGPMMLVTHNDQLFVTDGVADYAKPNRVMEAFDSSLCANLKAKGVKIGVIYTTYFDIPNEPFWVYYIKPFSDQIAPALEACASPGWFFEAQYADDIDAALQELMKLVLPRPQLTR